MTSRAAALVAALLVVDLAFAARLRPDRVRLPTSCRGNGAPLVGIAAPSVPYELRVIWEGFAVVLASVDCADLAAGLEVELEAAWPDSMLFGCLAADCVPIKPRAGWLDPDADPDASAD